MKKTKASTEELQGLSTQDWIDAAREMLIDEGVDAVKIDRLAKACKVTRGGFYWRFESREHLLDTLLEDWRVSNSAALLAVLERPGSAEERFHELMRLWIEEKSYRPDYDLAIRNWATNAPKVAAAVREVDDMRIEVFHRFFMDAGYPEDEALVRARITYYHQVGYYAMGVKETSNQRIALSELYFKILTGFANSSSPAEVEKPKRKSKRTSAAKNV